MHRGYLRDVETHSLGAFSSSRRRSRRRRFAQDAQPVADRAGRGDRTRALGSAEPISKSRARRTTGPGRDIVVTGRNIPNVLRNSTEVSRFLQRGHRPDRRRRTSPGRFRVSGLPWRRQRLRLRPGLGDRYSLALLNGSPCRARAAAPSRPLDIFPTGIIAAQVVQRAIRSIIPASSAAGDQPSPPPRSGRDFLTVAARRLDGETTAISAIPITEATSTARLRRRPATAAGLRERRSACAFTRHEHPPSAGTSPPPWSTPRPTAPAREQHRPNLGEMSAPHRLRPAGARIRRPRRRRLQQHLANARPIQQISVDPELADPSVELPASHHRQ